MASAWIPDEARLDALERAAFGYFLEAVHPRNGLVADTTRPHSPVSIAVVGFALAAYPVAVERGWMERGEAVGKCLAALSFFLESDQSGSPEATGYQGFYYHFLDFETGARVWRSELSMVDSALLIAGALTAAMYFRADSSAELRLRDLALALYRRVDWRWAQGSGATIHHGWKPESGFLHYCWDGYNEAILLYALALGSPTHPITGDCFEAWTATYQWENLYGIELLVAAPLFVHQFSHAWIDFRGIRDRFMREKRCDYFENSRRATEVQREYARRNPQGFAGYDESCWGLTACDGPGQPLPAGVGLGRRLLGYAARGVPHGPDDGTLAPWASLASLPFSPDLAWSTATSMIERYPEVVSQGRLASSFNPSLATERGGAWVSPGHFGLDQGLLVLMIENYRTELVWRLMRGCPYVAAGLRRAGFRGGWLQ